LRGHPYTGYIIFLSSLSKKVDAILKMGNMIIQVFEQGDLISFEAVAPVVKSSVATA
jgi:hypothetical protein